MYKIQFILSDDKEKFVCFSWYEVHYSRIELKVDSNSFIDFTK